MKERDRDLRLAIACGRLGVVLTGAWPIRGDSQRPVPQAAMQSAGKLCFLQAGLLQPPEASDLATNSLPLSVFCKYTTWLPSDSGSPRAEAIGNLIGLPALPADSNVT